MKCGGGEYEGGLYRAAHGSEPVDEFIERLAEPRKQAGLDNQIDRLNMLHPNDPPLRFAGIYGACGEVTFGCKALLGLAASAGEGGD